MVILLKFRKTNWYIFGYALVTFESGTYLATHFDTWDTTLKYKRRAKINKCGTGKLWTKTICIYV